MALTKNRFNIETPPQLTDYELKNLIGLNNSIVKGLWSTAGLVSMLKQIEEELGLVRVQTFAGQIGRSQPHVRKRYPIHVRDGVQFVVDENHYKR